MDELKDSALDLVLAGTRDGVLMVESEAQELTEEVMLGAVKFGHEQMGPVIDAIIALAERCAKEPRDVPAPAPEGGQVKATRRCGGVIENVREASTEGGKPDTQDRNKKATG